MVMLYSFTVNMVGAALRLGIHQHHDGQRIIHELKPDILRIVKNVSIDLYRDMAVRSRN
jgi:urease accessory protein